MLKSTILSVVAFMFVFVGWVITPVQAHIGEPCPHKDLTHDHCNGAQPPATTQDLHAWDAILPADDGEANGCNSSRLLKQATTAPSRFICAPDGICSHTNAVSLSRQNNRIAHTHSRRIIKPN